MKKSKFQAWGAVLLFCPAIAFSEITEGPYITEPQQTSMCVMWESDISEAAILKYGESYPPEYSISVEPLDQMENRFLYSVKIENLKPGSKYNYQVLMSDVKGDASYFTTAPDKDTPIKLVAIGDSRSGHEIHKQISELIENISPDLVISMGDLVAQGGAFDQWGPHFFQPAADLIDHVPLISTVGDHDTQIDEAEIFNYYFRFTEDHQKIWFSYDYGPAHFVSLDYRGEDDPEMIEWFEKDMAKSKARWKFVYLHRPSYNTGGHRTNWGAGVWPELYRKYKVDIVFTGHSHLYERFFPMKPTNDPDAWPVTYITTGGAGAGLYEVVQHENIAITESVNHLLSIRLSSDSLKLTAYLPDMSVLDQIEIVKDINGQYNPEYTDLVKSQDIMDAYMVFAPRMYMVFDEKPEESKAAVSPISFTSRALEQEISFSVVLSEQSSEYYSIEPLSGVLKKDEPYTGEIKLYSKKEYQLDGRYFIPPVILNTKFKIGKESGTVIGEHCRYYPRLEN